MLLGIFCNFHLLAIQWPSITKRGCLSTKNCKLLTDLVNILLWYLSCFGFTTRRKKTTNFIPLKWLRWQDELSSADKCVVGEAYGYSSSYILTMRNVRNYLEIYVYFSIRWNKKVEENKEIYKTLERKALFFSLIPYLK